MIVMKRIHCFSIAILSFLCSWNFLIAHELPTDISQKSKPATVKVLLKKLASDAILEVKGRYLIYQPQNLLLIDSGISGKRAKISASGRGIKWGELFPASFDIRIVPGDSQSSLLVDGIQYKGCLEIYSINGTINIINEVDVENYLKSILTSRLIEPMSNDVLDLIAVVERTNLYALAYKNRGASWHLEAAKEGYQGYPITISSSQINQTIDRTRYLVMTYQNAPFPATWTKNAAGKTVAYTSIFRKGGETPPGVGNLPSSFYREKNKWAFDISKPELAHLFGLDQLSKLDLFHAENSEKIYGIRLTDGEHTKDLDFFTFQNGLGKDRLLSNDFQLVIEQDRIAFSGVGEGPGVGLCLASAEILLKKKQTLKQILSQFFPETELKPLKSLNPQSIENKTSTTGAYVWE